ncbi:hypothetical protein T484DRAFT_1838664 [Baffinella frigidus]|nr:hypothetical protein T484DRAFT_1838664 [Cryptophyta sp. CCMP2293]
MAGEDPAMAGMSAEQAEIDSARAEAEVILKERAALDGAAAIEEARQELRELEGGVHEAREELTVLEGAKADMRRLDDRKALFLAGSRRGARRGLPRLLQEAREELRELEGAKGDVRRLDDRKELFLARAHWLRKELFLVRAHWLRLVADLHTLSQRINAGAEALSPEEFLRDAEQLVAFKEAFELLPLRNGKPPALKKAVRPAMRDAARRLRAAGRST